MKLYFSNFEELAYNKKYILSKMLEYCVNEIEVHEAVPDKESGAFYCIENDFCGFSNDNCGKICKYYEPRNGKSGRCVKHRSCYDYGQKYILNINGRLKKI